MARCLLTLAALLLAPLAAIYAADQPARNMDVA